VLLRIAAPDAACDFLERTASIMAAVIREATTVWKGSLTEGSGQLDSGTGVISTPVTWAARTGEPEGHTSPEELIAAAHASCYAMAFSHALATSGNTADELTVTAKVSLEPKDGGGFAVTKSALTVVGKVPTLDDAGFKAAAVEAEKGCPISNALRNNLEITVDASLA
jgi:osmotically inducible protein OsmC